VRREYLKCKKIEGQVVQWILAVLGGLAALATIIHFLAPGAGKRLTELIIPNARVQWDRVLSKVGSARHRVWILQTWLPGLREPGNQKAWRRALKRKNVRFRVLLLDQRLVPFRLRAREKRVSELTQNVSDLGELSAEFNTNNDDLKIEVRFYSCLPFGPVYVIDDDIYWGIYLAHKDSMEGPAFHTRSDTPIGHFILDSLNAAWAKGSHTTGGLIVSPDRGREAQSHAHFDAEIARDVRKIASMLSPQTIEEFRRAPARGALCIVRHADTDLNAAGIISGDIDVGINSTGLQAAQNLSDTLDREHWDNIYSSPLRRCIETLTAIFPQRMRHVEIRDELRERAMGDLEGYYRVDYAGSLPQYDGVDVLNSPHVAPHNGESYCNVFHRIQPFLEGVIAEVNGGKRVLICSHEGPIRMMLMALEGLSLDEGLALHVGNAELRFFAPRTVGAPAD
jgi:broad specificity phosphatase PhoE